MESLQNSGAPSSTDDERLARLSGLADGEADAGEADALLVEWRRDPVLRARWHAYQLVGDVLRSEDLSGDPRHDATFLAQLRGRLESEPRIVAPSAVVSTQPAVRAFSPRRWQRPMSMVAGVLAVAGIGYTTYGTSIGGARDAVRVAAARAATAASGVADAPGIVPTSGPAPAAPAPVLVATQRVEGVFIRDAHLDRYLQAHRQFSLGGSFGAPAGALRSVDLPVGVDR